MKQHLQKFDEMLNTFVKNIGSKKDITHELEVKFKTEFLNKTDYLRVIQKCLECGYETELIDGFYLLRVMNSGYDGIRGEIEGLELINSFCKTNQYQDFNFIKKKPVVEQIIFQDMGYKISYQTETPIKIPDNWEDTPKLFRYMNRITFKHARLPIKIDTSIVKQSKKEMDGFLSSNVMNEEEKYEIEIELDISNKIKVDDIKSALRQSITHVLSGIQQSNYPISILEQDTILLEYRDLLQIQKNEFIGPSSITLENIHLNEKSKDNILTNYAITDKADGERGMLYISKSGRIYIITPQLHVKYTGKTTNILHSTLLDGEHITQDKDGKFINLFAIFDIYFLQKKNIRSLPFIQHDKKIETRYNILIQTVLNIRENINATKVGDFDIQAKVFQLLNSSNNKFNVEEFQNICIETLNTPHIYNTDGLIFTNINYGVGSNEKGKQGPMKKITWYYSFKWKPEQYNTIDFLIETIKDKYGKDIVLTSSDANEYKQCILNIGFNKEFDGELNPMLSTLGIIKSTIDNSYSKQPFYPTNPYDTSASRANIILKQDKRGKYQMFSEDGHIFNDGEIIEFRYDLTQKRGWNWKPLRVRYDKTSELKNGKTNYGNSYTVANSIWSSIHNPISLIELKQETNTNIENVYYLNNNLVSRNKQSDINLRDFHNLYVKKILISNAAKNFKKPILIDYACGKAGDLKKWIDADISFVFGLDISNDNIANKIDGAYARLKKLNNYLFKALFACADNSMEIKTKACSIDKSHLSQQILNCVFGIQKPPENWKNIDNKLYGIGKNGFDISSCQFALHYFAKNNQTMMQFLNNVSNCTKINGLFIGTCYDGQLIYNRLLNKPYGYIDIIENTDKETKEKFELLKIEKKYDDTIDNELTFGMQINVFQKSIGQYIPEYLVDFKLLNDCMRLVGFESVESYLFEDLFKKMMKEKNNDIYGKSYLMTNSEKELSFLNRTFCFKKIREPQENIYIEEKKMIPKQFKKIKNMFVSYNKQNKDNIIIPKQFQKINGMFVYQFH